MIFKLCVMALACDLIHALNNGLGLTPPMGWLSWERFRCDVDCKNDPDYCISERLYMTMADLMVSEGYRDAGYQYVNIDDCWPAKDRDSKGRLVADPDRFPSGIQALAKYVHSKGLKLGIYEDFGSKTCAGYPGSEYYMETDANTFAEWEVDSLKFDGCNSDPKDMPFGTTQTRAVDLSVLGGKRMSQGVNSKPFTLSNWYPVMGRFLNMTGRPILFNCQWPGYLVGVGIMPDYAAVRATCNLWRNYNDVQDSWDSVLDVIDHYGKDDGNFSAYAGPGGWNDPDELVVGDYGLSYYQQKAQFGMWALFAAPLLMSVDLRNVDPAIKQLLLNKNIIAINQDPLGNQAIRLFEVPGSISVWMKKLARPGSFAFGVLNKDNQGTPMVYTTSFSDLGLTNSKGYQAWEAFENKTIGSFSLTQEFKISVDPTSIYILVAIPL